MFDIGFWELCLITVVALLILGPERLPTAARTAGKWVSKIRGMVNNVKQEIDRELQLDEIRSKMQQQEEQLKADSGIADLKQAIDNTIADLDPVESSQQAKSNNKSPSEKPDDQEKL
ncbi:MAG: Sec-independent protein translocase protein TatB [Gammaproteobacteria bacterium]|nr:Sec-independent protein translocase protein TatB [Gammaproteobacteria bacterium]NNJ71942.1 twin-arginine translocase subunit TatB [Enterobacterales bacterium]